jgi:hypothetical protein
MVKCGVLFEVGNEFLNIIWTSVGFKGLIFFYLPVHVARKWDDKRWEHGNEQSSITGWGLLDWVTVSFSRAVQVCFMDLVVVAVGSYDITRKEAVCAVGCERTICAVVLVYCTYKQCPSR